MVLIEIKKRLLLTGSLSDITSMIVDLEGFLTRVELAMESKPN